MNILQRTQRCPHHMPSEKIRPTTLLGVCTSMKPALGREGKSAVRGLLQFALQSVEPVYPDVSLLDLRNTPLPWFDGRLPESYHDDRLQQVHMSVGQAGALLITVPAYWSGVSGVFKNFVDVLCGPRYDLAENTTTVFEGQPVGLIVVGADEESGPLAAGQAEAIVRSTGARLVAETVIVSNPREPTINRQQLAADLVALAAELAQEAYVTGQGRAETFRAGSKGGPCLTSSL